jgi:phage anti-repressor protein
MGLQEVKSRIERIYGFTMPESFFAFWEFAGRVSFQALRKTLGIDLAGPFDLLKTNTDDAQDPIWRARYYADPPEFLTLGHGDIDGYHWGYYLDDPAEVAPIVAAYHHSDGCHIDARGPDLFDAARFDLELCYRDNLDYLASAATDKEAYYQRLEQLDRTRDLLKGYATVDRNEKGRQYTETYIWVRETTAPTRDGMGILVPPGTYRQLSWSHDGSLQEVRQRGVLQPEAKYRAENDPFQRWNYRPEQEAIRQMADEAFKALSAGFPGTALKLGKDLWASGDQAHSYSLLGAAYDALHRPLLSRYLKIAREHRAWCDARRRPLGGLA